MEFGRQSGRPRRREFVAAVGAVAVALMLAVAAPANADRSSTIGHTGATVESWHYHWQIRFDNGVPVGGWADLTIWENGQYAFSGHIHNSGFTSYDFTTIWALYTPPPTPVPTFTVQGHVQGTLGAGSRDFDWNQRGSNPALTEAWRSGWQLKIRQVAKLDLSIIADIANTAGRLIPIVGPLL